MPLLPLLLAIAAQIALPPEPVTEPESELQSLPAASAIRGTVAMVETGDEATGPAAAFADGVERALADSGFTLLPDKARARFVATPAVQRTVSGMARTRIAPSKARTGGGMVFGNGVGMGVQVPFGSAIYNGQMIATELTLRIVERGATGPAWEGSAITYQVAGTRADDPKALGKRLSDAILRNFKGPSGVLIGVP